MLLIATLALVSTRFAVQSANGVDWLVDPRGNRLWSFGVCCVDRGAERKDDKPSNPGYAAYRYYVTPEEWANDTTRRLRSWGFNTIGAWSDDPNLLGVKDSNLRFTPILHMGSSAGAPWKDMWDPKTVAIIDSVARDGIKAHRGDSRVVGYFSDNEMGWWEGALFEWGWKAGGGTRSRLVAQLESAYGQDWRRLAKDFVPKDATSFGELEKKGRVYLRPGGNGMAFVQRYIATVADRYYSLCKSIVRKYDPGALYLGDRYISNFYPEVARVAGKYCDVVSTNLNADWNDGSFAQFYLPTLRRSVGRPIMVTEYYVAAVQNRTGNKNDSSGFPTVQTQADRARVFSRQTRTLLMTPYIVGAHWFQYYDEPRNGRGDGENYDMGLVDVFNQPYGEVTREASRLNLIREHSRAADVRQSARRTIPALTGRQSRSLADWPRERAFVGDGDRGDLYVGWSPNALYVAVYWNEDLFPEAFYADGKIPGVDRARLDIPGLGVSAVVGPGGAPRVTGAEIIEHKEGTRCQATLKLPMTLRSGQALPLDVRFVTRGLAYRMRWTGKFILSEK